MTIANEVKVPISIALTFNGADNEDLHAFYQEARDRWIRWTDALVNRSKEYGEAKTAVDEYGAQMERISHAWVRDGVIAGCKNDREREAALDAMTDEDAGWQEAQRSHARAKKQLLCEIEPGLEQAKYMRRLAEEDCRWATASLLAIAGIVEAGRGER